LFGKYIKCAVTKEAVILGAKGRTSILVFIPVDRETMDHALLKIYTLLAKVSAMLAVLFWLPLRALKR
jgi:hypothetical protein